jgi:DNA-binding beta-propeller fold protein YncE
VAIDTIHHRLFVADGQNNRVLVYNLDTNDQPLDYFADFVLGQPNFLTDTSGVTSSTMSSPMSPVYDSVNNRLYVADSNNSRILIFDVATIVNGENAVNVLGQPNFTTNTFSVAQNTTPQPLGIALDPTNNRLFVTAFTTNRVTVFDVTTITNGENAVNVLGQVNFTASTNATTASTLSRPRSVAHDSTNNRLFVADSDNNRVLVYNTTTITNGMSAVNVLGQANLNTRTNGLPGSDPSTIPDASGLSYDAVNNRLFVTTPTLNQVRVFDTTTITNGMASIAEVGSPAYGNVTQ